jgi:protein BCP1
LHELADLILSQPLIGTTIKTDGIGSDPLAILTVLNLHVHKVKSTSYLGSLLTKLVQDHPSIRALVQYMLQKISPDTAFTSTLQLILQNESSHVGLVIGERVYNMPPQVIPPMYRMLQDEIGWAVEEASKLSV